MEGQKSGGSMFMCRLCNLFSPSHSQLLSHCSQLHPEQEPPDSIIVTLQPLSAGPGETLTENPVKRKRGRPKGSKNKTRSDWIEVVSGTSHSTKEEDEKQEERENPGESHEGVLELECKKCRRSFSNRRQILKHICLKEEEDEEEEDKKNGNISGAAGVGYSVSANHFGEADPDHDQAKADGLRGQRTNKKSRLLYSDRNTIHKDGGLTPGNQKPVISVMLTEHETIPGATKMVPVQASPEETESGTVQTQSQDSATCLSQVQSANSQAIACTDNIASDIQPSPNPASEPSTVNKGFQEYSIKQIAASQNQSQLKIFTCEFCNKIFKFKHSLTAHLRTHTQEKPFKCPHCNYASAIKANLNVHLRKHTGERFTCQHCPFTCLSPGHLKVHVERVHFKVKQHCSFCQKKYSDVKNLLKHIEKRHNMKDPTIQRSYQQLRLKTRQGHRQLLYHCPTCNRCFKNKLERERHLLLHGPQRPFACLLCDHATTKMAALCSHVRKHLFLYVCCKCSGMFVSSQRLRSHLADSHPHLDQEQAFIDCINTSYLLMQPGGEGWREEGLGEEAGKEDRGEEEMTKEDEGMPLKRTEEPRTKEEAQTEEVREKDGGGREECPGVDSEWLEAGGKDETEEDGERTGEEVGTQGGKESRLENGRSESVGQAVSIESITPAEQCTETPDLVEATAEENGAKQKTSTPEAENLPQPLSDNTQTEENAFAHVSEDTQTALASDSAHLPASEDSLTPHSENVPINAFEQVVSSIQKTQLNMETFQRLRKVYGDLECKYCGKLFWYQVHYNLHVRTHTKEHMHYCSQCNYSSITKSCLKRHLIQKHSGLLLPCHSPGCKYSTSDKYKLQAHQKTHQEQRKSVSCPICNQNYPEHRLKNHIKTSHSDTAAVQGKSMMVKRAEKCPYCDSYFLKNSSDLQQHIWAHQGLKPYQCTLCDYAGRSKSNLKAHMNRHSTERSHLCDLCGKKFKSKVTLKSHRLSHTAEGKQFQCSECDYTGVSKPALLRHMEQHAEFKPFRCAHCHYSCNIAGPLKRHYSRKHPQEEYHNAGPGIPTADTLEQQGGMKCPVCEFVYGTKWELNRHLKNKHNLKLVERESSWEVVETSEEQYVSVEEEEQQTEAAVAALQENNNGELNILQQIIELNSESHDAVASMVAMAPGTVTMVEQVQVADVQEPGNHSNQLMVVHGEDGQNGDQLMVVEDTEGLEALAVFSEGENTPHYIVYVQEQTVEID